MQVAARANRTSASVEMAKVISRARRMVIQQLLGSATLDGKCKAHRERASVSEILPSRRKDQRRVRASSASNQSRTGGSSHRRLAIGSAMIVRPEIGNAVRSASSSTCRAPRREPISSPYAGSEVTRTSTESRPIVSGSSPPRGRGSPGRRSRSDGPRRLSGRSPTVKPPRARRGEARPGSARWNSRADRR